MLKNVPKIESFFTKRSSMAVDANTKKSTNGFKRHKIFHDLSIEHSQRLSSS